MYSTITVLLIISLEAGQCRFSVCVPQIQNIFEEHLYIENQNLYYKLQCSFHKTPTTKTEIVRLTEQMLWKLENDHMNG